MPLRRALAQLIDQVLHQLKVGGTHLQHRHQIGGTHGSGQIQQGALFEELAAEAGKRAEQQRTLAINPAGVEVGHRHRWSPHRRLAVDLGPLTIGQLRVTANQPEATHWEASEISRLWDPGTLQQRQGTTTGTEENKGSPHFFFARGPLEHHAPVGLSHVAAAQTFEVVHLSAVLNSERSALLQGHQVGPGEGAEINVRASINARGRHRLLEIAPRHHQGHPFGELALVFAPAHPGKGRQLLQLAEALPQKGNVLRRPHGADVGRLVEKAAGVEVAPLPQRPPELEAAFKRSIDGHRFGRRHRSIRLNRGVIQLAVGGMAGAGIVHRSAALQSRRFEALHQKNPQLRVEFMQQRRQGGAHDSSAHQHGVVTGLWVERTVVLHRSWRVNRSRHPMGPLRNLDVLMSSSSP